MILNFLQTRMPPILPALQQRPHKEYITQDGSESGFDDNLEKLQGFGKENTDSLGQLLFGFFRFYGFEFDYDNSVVSVRNGRVLTREEKKWGGASKEGLWRLCIEEPFNATRNLGNSADSTAFKGIHQEIRNAFDKLVQLRLDQISEPYVFPVEEKRPETKKQSSVPKPILSAAPPRNKQSGSRTRNASLRANNNTSYRRASSGAAPSRNGMGYWSPMQMPNELIVNDAINQHLFQQWQLFAQQQAHVQSQAQAHAQSVVQGSASQSREGSANQTPRLQYASNPATVPMLGNPVFPNFMYAAPMDQSQPMSHSVSQDGSRTNPSSPQISDATPARRGMQRASVSSGSQGASIRSQSQPARGMSPNMFVPGLQILGYDASGLPLYGYPQPDVTASYRQADSALRYANSSMPDMTGEIPTKEYVGYWVNDTRQQRPQVPVPAPGAEFVVPKIPSFAEASRRVQRPSQDLQPIAVGATRQSSRSPSPLGHSRHNSTPLRSAPLPSGTSPQFGRPDLSRSADQTRSSSIAGVGSNQGLASGGLLIVNGSSYSSSGGDNDSALAAATDSLSLASPSPDDFSSGPYFSNADTLQENGVSEGPFTQPIYQSDFARHHSGEVMQPNGIPQQTYGVDPAYIAASFGSPMQAFPAYVDPAVQSSPLLPQEEESVTSPRTVHQSPWQTITPLATAKSTSASPPAETHKDVNGKDALKSPGTKSAPVLSPVIETRTPSPSAHRRSDNFRPNVTSTPFMNGSVWTNGSRPEPTPPTPASRQGGQSAAQAQASKQMPPPPLPISAGSVAPAQGQPSGQSSGQGQWQQTSTGRKRTGGRRRSKSGPAARSSGDITASKPQPLPTRPEDRKGG
jgi:hypothetical protein